MQKGCVDPLKGEAEAKSGGETQLEPGLSEVTEFWLVVAGVCMSPEQGPILRARKTNMLKKNQSTLENVKKI